MKSKILLLAALGFGAVPAGAQDVSVALERCAAVSDDHARLSCYDGIAAGFKHAAVPASHLAVATTVPAAAAPVPSAALPAAAPASAPAAPVTAPPPAPLTAAAKVAAFGTDSMRKPDVDRDSATEVDEVKATITQVEFSRNNRFTVTLDNGQVWRQLESDSTKARFRQSGEVVTISHGVLGSYNLTLDGHGAVLYKVRRVR